MPRILQFTSGPNDWQALLADPAKHWRTGYSAKTVAHCWEEADGLPREVRNAFAKSSDPLLQNLSPILAVPEFTVPLPGGDRSSQNDVFVLARSSAGPIVVMVEGKVSETFGPTLDKWRADKRRDEGRARRSSGKPERLRFLLRKLGIRTAPRTVRYQLLHRAASAIITAEQYRAVAAVLLVHSFSEKEVQDGWTDYEAFARLFGVAPVVGQVQRLSDTSAVPLFGSWVAGDCGYLKR